MSEMPSLLRSAGQPLAPQCRMEFVPAEVSRAGLKPSQAGALAGAGPRRAPHVTRAVVPGGVSAAVPKPSQSGSLGGTGQGGRFWEEFGQRGQLSVLSGTPSPSPSGGQGVPPIETPSGMLADI